MRHVDPATLSLVALGEATGTNQGTEHIKGCASCTAYVRERDSIVALARAAASAGTLLAPRAEVWLAIRTELGLAPARLPGRIHSETEHPGLQRGAGRSATQPLPRRVRVFAVALLLLVVLGAVVVGMLVWPPENKRV